MTYCWDTRDGCSMSPMRRFFLTTLSSGFMPLLPFSISKVTNSHSVLLLRRLHYAKSRGKVNRKLLHIDPKMNICVRYCMGYKTMSTVYTSVERHSEGDLRSTQRSRREVLRNVFIARHYITILTARPRQTDRKKSPHQIAWL